LFDAVFSLGIVLIDLLRGEIFPGYQMKEFVGEVEIAPPGCINRIDKNGHTKFLIYYKKKPLDHDPEVANEIVSPGMMTIIK
jgi:hypothetical protein